MGTFLLILALIVGGILFLASRKPDDFTVERRATIAAPPEAVFAQVNDLVAWQAWSPWAKKDSNAKATFGTITAGEGARFGWDGNNAVGKGTMTIIAAQPHEKVSFRLDFEKPFKGTNFADFTFTPSGNGTQVVWAMRGTSNFMSKVICVFMNMDKMVGGDFEAGLANMKAICETPAG
jgi:uncharacterized protein YndB with AHSA1/START domain